jgi:transposase
LSNIKQEYKENVGSSERDVISLQTSRKQDIGLSETPVKRPRRKLCSTKQENKKSVSSLQENTRNTTKQIAENIEVNKNVKYSARLTRNKNCVQ